jgi:hypothetical protein
MTTAAYYFFCKRLMKHNFVLKLVEKIAFMPQHWHQHDAGELLHLTILWPSMTWDWAAYQSTITCFNWRWPLGMTWWLELDNGSASIWQLLGLKNWTTASWLDIASGLSQVDLSSSWDQLLPGAKLKRMVFVECSNPGGTGNAMSI